MLPQVSLCDCSESPHQEGLPGHTNRLTQCGSFLLQSQDVAIPKREILGVLAYPKEGQRKINGHVKKDLKTLPSSNIGIQSLKESL